jgi:hypothetical protein
VFRLTEVKPEALPIVSLRNITSWNI